MPRTRNWLPFVSVLALIGVISMVGGISTTAPVGNAVTITVPKLVLTNAEPQDVPDGDAGYTTSATSAVATPTTWNAAKPLLTLHGNVTKCGSTFSGGFAASTGRIYHACGSNNIHVRGNKGVLKEVIDTGESAPVGRRDVAANAAGTLVYYSVGDRVDTGLSSAQLAAGWGSIHRMTWTGTKWKRDTTFHFGPFNLYGGAPWSARYMTVAPDGTLYTSVNAFVFAIDTSGRVRADENGQYNASGTRIGGPIAGYDPVGAAPGFNVVEGVAMNVEGTYLYATEEDYDFVARFTRNPAGAWVPDRIAGVKGSPGCGTNQLAAPYDVGVTAAGSVMVANTTCSQIRTYNADLTYRNTAITLGGSLPHGIALAGNGAIVLPWRNEIYTRK